MIASFFNRLYQKLANLNGHSRLWLTRRRTDGSMTSIKRVRENSFMILSRPVLLLAMALFLLAGVGCSTDNAEEQEGGGISEPERRAGKTGKPLSRSPRPRSLRKGLRGDREQAKYTDEALRADTSLQPPLPRPQKPDVVEEVKTEVVESSDAAGETVTENRGRKSLRRRRRRNPSSPRSSRKRWKEAPLAPPPEAKNDCRNRYIRRNCKLPPPQRRHPGPRLRRSGKQVISGEMATRAPVESVYEQQLAAQNADAPARGYQGGRVRHRRGERRRRHLPRAAPARLRPPRLRRHPPPGP